MAEPIDINKMEEDFEDEGEEDVEMSEEQVGKEADLTGDGGVIKTTTVLGTGWERPQPGDKVSVHYTGTLEDGTKFDSSVDRGDPFAFDLGKSQVIKGWDVGVATMKKGEKATFKLRAEYAYGERGSPPKIPPNATLLFDVELLSWVSTNDLSPEKDGSIVKHVVEEADMAVWDKPQLADIVTVQLSANVVGETEPFAVPETLEFKVEEGAFCPAVKIAVQDMKKGEAAKLTVAPRYAFGDAGREGCPPGATIEVHLKLVAVKTVKTIDPDHTGAITKTILQDGKAYSQPNDEATVTVSWTGKLADGTVFDKVERAQYVTSNEQFPCDALELAVMSMREGEVAEVAVHDAVYGFGAAGAPPAVPPGALVTYHIELHDFKNGVEAFEMETAAKLDRADKFKLQGNAAFKAGNYRKARRLYEKVESSLSYDDSFGAADKARSRDIKLSCNLNMSAVSLKMGDHRGAASYAGKVLAVRPGHVKALFRRSQAYMETSDFVEAENDMKAAMLEEPDNRDLQLAYRKLKQRMKAHNKKDAKLFGAMFSKVGQLYSDVPTPAPAPAAAEADPGPVPEVEMDVEEDGAADVTVAKPVSA